MVTQNDADQTGDTTIAEFHAPDESSTGQQMVDRQGQPIKDVNSIPTLKNPVTNIETEEDMQIKILGEKFAETVKLDVSRSVERVVDPSGEYAKNRDAQKIVEF